MPYNVQVAESPQLVYYRIKSIYFIPINFIFTIMPVSIFCIPSGYDIISNKVQMLRTT